MLALAIIIIGVSSIVVSSLLFSRWFILYEQRLKQSERPKQLEQEKLREERAQELEQQGYKMLKEALNRGDDGHFKNAKTALKLAEHVRNGEKIS